jgi:hypothetical protein
MGNSGEWRNPRYLSNSGDSPSGLWKAAVRDRELSTDNLTLDRMTTIFTVDIRRRSVDFQVPPDPLAAAAWIDLLQRIYADPT